MAEAHRNIEIAKERGMSLNLMIYPHCLHYLTATFLLMLASQNWLQK